MYIDITSLNTLEMGLIVGKPEMKKTFILQWMTKYVPAILEYALNSNKKNICSMLSSVNYEGNQLIITKFNAVNINTIFR